MEAEPYQNWDRFPLCKPLKIPIKGTVRLAVFNYVRVTVVILARLGSLSNMKTAKDRIIKIWHFSDFLFRLNFLPVS